MTFREFSGKNVEEAIRAAMAEFSADLGDLDIEILAQGSRGILGVGGEEARILAAPKSAVAAAEAMPPEPELEPEPASSAASGAGADQTAAIAVGEAQAAEATGPAALEEEDLAGDQAAELARTDAG
ncbi:MAG: Jag N-terminal domain-containing protein, partial [Candidatus Limnocylindria bacterium]